MSTALYTDLSAYYDLLCADIDYHTQSQAVQRLQQIFGNGGKTHLDLACGTGPHIRHFLDVGFSSSGLDIHQPMLDLAARRCPEAQFFLGDMSALSLSEPVDLITCFLYSIHYNHSVEKLKTCIASVYGALQTGGVFCFNAVNKNKIVNDSAVKHSVTQENAVFTFSSHWHYCGHGEKQSLELSIKKPSIIQRSNGMTHTPWSLLILMNY